MSSTDTSLLTLGRWQLTRIFQNNPVAVKAFENLFNQYAASSNVDISGVELTADQALQMATLALAEISSLALLAKLGASAPVALPSSDRTPFEYQPAALLPPTVQGDLAPPIQPVADRGLNEFQPALGIDKIAYLTLWQQIAYLQQGAIVFSLKSINLSVAADARLTITIPSGVTRYRVESVVVSDATTAVSTAQIGVYTGGSQTGAVIAAQQVLSLSTSPNTVGNLISLTVAQNLSLTVTTLFINVGTPQGAGLRADVTVTIKPLT